jgi:hypothetical protein
MPLHVSGVNRPSSGGSAQKLFGVIMCVGCVLTACRLWWSSVFCCGQCDHEVAIHVI